MMRCAAVREAAAAGEVDLLIGHLVQFRNGDFLRLGNLREVLALGGLIPLKEIGFIDEIAGDHIMHALQVVGDFGDFIERGNGRPDDMEQAKVEGAGAGGFEDANALKDVEGV